eukprot:Skav222537  [mRNA]  locus=scaffold2875:185176:186354:+ [translate_table: standard]
MSESPLSQYFLSKEYQNGQAFGDSGYSLDEEQNTFINKKSGIKVWSFALDKRPAAGRQEDWQVLYHYTSEMGFDLITDISKQQNVELFASREAQKDCHFGPGLYATSKAPDQWQRQEEVLMNNYYPTRDNWTTEKPNQQMPTWMGHDLEAYVKSHHHGKAAFCIAVLCDRQEVINAMTEPTKPPALRTVRRAGEDVAGTRQPPERDVWVISEWSFATDKPSVENLKLARQEIAPIILSRLKLKLDIVAAVLTRPGFSAAGEMLHLLNKEGPVLWSSLMVLCHTLKIPISSVVKMMADAEANESRLSAKHGPTVGSLAAEVSQQSMTEAMGQRTQAVSEWSDASGQLEVLQRHLDFMSLELESARRERDEALMMLNELQVTILASSRKTKSAS